MIANLRQSLSSIKRNSFSINRRSVNLVASRGLQRDNPSNSCDSNKDSHQVRVKVEGCEDEYRLYEQRINQNSVHTANINVILSAFN